ncbi:hypothetical protein PVK06_029544 [Gossypium arboreum]|uniref:DDE Tnp4 domain-containing protein n=1 Tax=Gossypium arboreum TaxID=29729 RepID=A0ABR0P6X9_GOSAR|nr:hypothetical protein PVK06_029544 [Gossypium arboreum]
MEIGSSQFFASEVLAYNNTGIITGTGGGDGGKFYWFQDMEDDKKRSGNNEFMDLHSSISLFDDEMKHEQLQWFTDPDQGRGAVFESNYSETNDYFDQIQSHYTEIDEFDDSRKKRARKSSSPVSVPATEDSGPSQSGGTGRRLWVKDRSKDWWEKCNHPDFPDEEFKRAFRMSKSTFDMICKELESTVMKKNTTLRDAIPVRQRVAVCIWRLATGEPLRMVSKRFGLGISTCHKLVLEVCAAIKTVLMPKYVQWPDENKLNKTKLEFESVTGIPNVAGAIYTTHVPIIAPKSNAAAYLNKKQTEKTQKQSYSITLQGIVDPTGVFTDVSIGWPGSMSDEQIFEKSAFHQSAVKGQVKGVWVVGSKGYPLMDWVLVPYAHQNLTWTQHAFNEKIEEIEKMGKEAFARLKGRWSCLQKRADVKLQELPAVLGACCVLHNICELRNEEMEPELKIEISDDEVVPENNLRSMVAVQARDYIAHNLLHHGLAGTGFL